MRDDMRDRQEGRGRARLLRAVPTLVVLNCLLLLPTWIAHGGVGPQWFALEAGLVTVVFLLLPAGRTARVLAGVVGALASALFVLSLGDATARMSLARPLNLYLDVQLVDSVVHLLDGAVGRGWGLAVLAGLVLLVAAAGAGVAALLAGLPEPRSGWRPRLPALAALVLLAAAVPVRWLHPRGVVLGLPATHLVREQTALMARMLKEREAFRVEMAASPVPPVPPSGLLSELDGRDVVLAFVESYGISAVDDPRYAPVLRPRLEAMAARLDSAGVQVATGLLAAPSQGGMSWLGHGSVLSGLWLENQLRYDLLLASQRPTLVDDFENAGYRTAALMPAITMAWPEGQRFGYEEIWARKDIDYAGPPLNWVTMPDQFTWSFLENTIRREADDGRPLFAELGLISSHAPWTPILDVLPGWDAIGDGAVFQRWADAGEAPEQLWKDHDRVREHYALAVGYAVDVLASYAASHVDDGLLLIALGDHQPAPLITGDDAPRSVPVHVMATDPALLEPFLAWGFAPGTLPPEPRAPVRRMSEFRGWFLDAFTPAAASTPTRTTRAQP